MLSQFGLKINIFKADNGKEPTFGQLSKIAKENFVISEKNESKSENSDLEDDIVSKKNKESISMVRNSPVRLLSIIDSVQKKETKFEMRKSLFSARKGFSIAEVINNAKRNEAHNQKIYQRYKTDGFKATSQQFNSRSISSKGFNKNSKKISFNFSQEEMHFNQRNRHLKLPQSTFSSSKKIKTSNLKINKKKK